MSERNHDDDNDDVPGALDRTFAVMLAELEDAETELTKRQAALARQLDNVSGELDRLAKVKAAMLGKPPLAKRRARGEPSKAGPTTPAAEAKVRRILAYARERDGEAFSGAEMAARLDITTQGIGPVLAGMVRRGELVSNAKNDAGRPLYELPG